MVRPHIAFLTVLVLAISGICFAQTKTKSAAKVNPAHKNATAPAAIPNAVQERLITREKDLFAAEQRRAFATIDEALAEDFHEIASDGELHTKAEVMPLIGDVKIEDYSLTDFKVLPIGERCAIITYRADIRATYKGQYFPPKLYMSSVWVRRQGSWRLTFHQATPVPQAKSE
jgi:hypothetical protein